MSVFSYFQETQAEMRHVSWPTRMQTIVYTVLVITISIFIALYLGLFDYVFTSTLARLAGVQQAAPIEQNAAIATTSAATTTNVNFDLPIETQ